MPVRDTPTLLDLVEEPFDQVARTIRIGAKTDWVFAISFRRNVRPSSLLSGKLPDPVRVLSTIREQHRLWEQGAFTSAGNSLAAPSGSAFSRLSNRTECSGLTAGNGTRQTGKARPGRPLIGVDQK